MLDYYPSGSGFRISGGLTAGGYVFDASTASLEFDGTTYTSDFDLNIKQDKNIVPVIALGYTRPVGQSGWQILAEAGARLTHLTATVSGQMHWRPPIRPRLKPISMNSMMSLQKITSFPSSQSAQAFRSRI